MGEQDLSCEVLTLKTADSWLSSKTNFGRVKGLNGPSWIAMSGVAIVSANAAARMRSVHLSIIYLMKKFEDSSQEFRAVLEQQFQKKIKDRQQKVSLEQRIEKITGKTRQKLRLQ
jgi:hypothetical protein